MFKKLFTENLNEKTEYKVYYVSNELWVAYGQGSGTTAYMPDTRKYLTDKKGDDHYDDIMRNIKKFAESTKPMKAKGDAKMYEVPVYEPSNSYETYDVWGGDKKPSKKYYMIVTSSSTISVLNLFEKKNEALAWMKSIA